MFQRFLPTSYIRIPECGLCSLERFPRWFPPSVPGGPLAFDLQVLQIQKLIKCIDTVTTRMQAPPHRGHVLYVPTAPLEVLPPRIKSYRKHRPLVFKTQF